MLAVIAAANMLCLATIKKVSISPFPRAGDFPFLRISNGFLRT